MAVQVDELLNASSHEIPSDAVAQSGALKVVLCGSFRRDELGLRRVFAELTHRYDLLSPVGLDFVDPSAEFVRLGHEVHRGAREIEDAHLGAISNADFVWLHAPDGYVGTSAALELGHARALGVPVFCSDAPVDEMLREYVRVVDSVEQIPGIIESEPGRGLEGLQAHYARAAARRGWAYESPAETMMLLTEEMGELARAVRKTQSLSRHHAYTGGSAADELADVQLYLVHLANVLGIDIAAAVTAKEAVNRDRFESSRIAG